MAERKALVAPAKSAERKPLERAPSPRKEVADAASYFTQGADKEGVEFFTSGCALLDAAIGGGWAEGRVSNVVGDKSAGKTLIAMESTANFTRKYSGAKPRYAESEAAFDQAYARALGIPIDRIIFNKEPMRTVEQWHKDLETYLDGLGGQPGLYILDSLDAISDEAEQKAEFGEASYGGKKPKLIGQLFRDLVDELEAKRCHLMIISQIRDKLNVTFGETKTRSGGRALDFYASQIVWLAEIGKIKRVIDKIERVVGIDVRARVKKNKVGLPFREADYPILFGYGIDDLMADVAWLIEVGREELIKPLGMSKTGYKTRLNHLRDKGGQEVQDLRAALAKIVHEEWATIETGFLPKSTKY
jgi:recombination protein RecA